MVFNAIFKFQQYFSYIMAVSFTGIEWYLGQISIGTAELSGTLDRFLLALLN
jgi:hypothetical protein